MDGTMFSNQYLKFDVDDELDAISKARAFVADVCKTLDFPRVVREERKEVLSVARSLSPFVD